MDQFFVSARQASRTHKLEGAARYLIRNGDGATEEGTWILKTEISKLKLRNRKEELKNRKARKTLLEATYGTLPENWHKLTDEQIGLYFSIQQRLERGEIIRCDKSRLFPQHWLHKGEMKSWLGKHGRLFTCPVSALDYMPNFTTVDEMAEIPGFWQTLENIFGESELLRAFMASQKVQALAITEII